MPNRSIRADLRADWKLVVFEIDRDLRWVGDQLLDFGITTCYDETDCERSLAS